MQTHLRFSLALAALIVVGGACTPAWAQTASAGQSARSFQGLFGGSGSDPSVRHGLDVYASLFEAYDDNMLGDLGGTAQPSSLLQESGFYTGVAAGLSYSWQGKRVQVGATVGTEGRYYQETGEYLGTNQSVGVGVAASFARRTRVLLNQSVSYSPAYFYGLFPEIEPGTPGHVVGTGDPLADQNMYVYDTSASLTHGITRRSDVEALAGFRYSDFDNQATLTQSLTSYHVGGRYRYNLSRDATLRLGYIYRSGGYGYGLAAAERTVALHDIDVGVDYRKALSLSRRTTIDFGAGPAIVSSPALDGNSSQLTYRVVSHVGLSHSFGRSWRSSVVYDRGVGFAEGFPQPVFSDAVNASVNGFFSRRVDFRAVAGLAIGDDGLSAAAKRFKAYSASANVRMALGRNWALTGEYQFYDHDLGDIVFTSTPLPNQLRRNTVSIGLTYWLPILRR